MAVSLKLHWTWKKRLQFPQRLERLSIIQKFYGRSFSSNHSAVLCRGREPHTPDCDQSSPLLHRWRSKKSFSDSKDVSPQQKSIFLRRAAYCSRPSFWWCRTCGGNRMCAWLAVCEIHVTYHSALGKSSGVSMFVTFHSNSLK